jgi:hypothetical protein
VSELPASAAQEQTIEMQMPRIGQTNDVTQGKKHDTLINFLLNFFLTGEAGMNYI